MRIIVAITALLMFYQVSFAQSEKLASNNINVNILTNESLISVNYESYFSRNDRRFFVGGIGCGYQEEFSINIFGGYTPFDQFITIPHYFSYNLGRNNNFLERGLGGAVISRVRKGYKDRTDWTGYSVFPIIGYRYQPSKKNSLNFRIHLSYPLASSMIEGDKLTDWILFIPVGGSVGWSF